MNNNNNDFDDDEHIVHNYDFWKVDFRRLDKYGEPKITYYLGISPMYIEPNGDVVVLYTQANRDVWKTIPAKHFDGINACMWKPAKNSKYGYICRDSVKELGTKTQLALIATVTNKN